MAITSEQLKQIIEEISNGGSEETRRAFMKRRHDIYTDGGKKFLIEQIEREFSHDALREMRLAPINILKKVINKRSAVYKAPPIRVASDGNQDLVDFYSAELEMDQTMTKANRYFNLFANTAIYPIPTQEGLQKVLVVPPYLYSIHPDPIDPTKVDTWIFNAFVEDSHITRRDDLASATGSQGWNREAGFKTQGDLVASNERDSDRDRLYIVWNDEQHVTTDSRGNILILDPERDDSQFVNPIGIAPVVNLAKDRDAEPWAGQGEDLVDLALALQIGWTDLLTIAKHQGFSILTVVSPEKPKQLNIGVNRAVWLKQDPELNTTPTISYVQSNSPLSEYKELLMDLLGLTLTTNDMSAQTVGGQGSAKNFNSGFQALIEMSDAIEAIEQDKPKLRDAEKDTWTIISKWHNWMFDEGILRDDARQLGKFTDDFEVNIIYRDMKPIESEQETLNVIKDLRDQKLLSRLDAMKKLHPEMTDEQIEEKLKEIDEESQANMERFSSMLSTTDNSEQEEEVDGEQQDQV
jgi:hypothetical protein